ncbi:hypothetical protein, partial [Corynebacterium glyciniphilum]|uniref:hypothetical protein n=1 Tax=Corynebacterium glyciniphilum TaxID=1404244 RepID=UPI001C92FC03
AERFSSVDDMLLARVEGEEGSKVEVVKGGNMCWVGELGGVEEEVRGGRVVVMWGEEGGLM